MREHVPIGLVPPAHFFFLLQEAACGWNGEGSQSRASRSPDFSRGITPSWRMPLEESAPRRWRQALGFIMISCGSLEVRGGNGTAYQHGYNRYFC